MPLEFVIDGPTSSQGSSSRSRQRWKQAVRTAAQKHWPHSKPFSEPVLVSIANFFVGRQPADLDNMAKPILDALGTVVYEDDRQVSDLLCRKRALGDDLRILSPSQVLLARLAALGPFDHILADDALNRVVTI